MIDQSCPEGVSFKSVIECIEYLPGGALKRDEVLKEGKYPLMNGGADYSGFYNDYNHDERTLTISHWGSSAGHVHRHFDKYWANNACWVFRQKKASELDIRFLYYILKKEEKVFMSAYAFGGATPNLSREMFNRHEIPIPPLPVQEEIVRVLDTFTELQVELQAELRAEQQKRLQQYNHYRDNMFSFEGRDDVEWKKLGEIASIKTGRRFVRTDIKGSGVPCFHYGDIYTYYGLTATQTKGYLDEELAKKLRFAQPNDVVVVCAGENDMDIGVGVAWLGDEPAVVHDACCILHHNQNPRYISHFLRTHNYHLQMKKYAKNGKISSLPASGLAEALIPIPSLDEQERIASILDRFDALTRDLSSGIPIEIEKRRQQYEFYRDKLLTFKRKDA